MFLLMRRLAMLILALSPLAGDGRGRRARPRRCFCWEFDLRRHRRRRTASRGPRRREHVAAYAGDDELHLFGGDDCVDDRPRAPTTLQLGPGERRRPRRGRGDDAVYGRPRRRHVLARPRRGHRRRRRRPRPAHRRARRPCTATRSWPAPATTSCARANAPRATPSTAAPGYDVAIARPRRPARRACERVEVARRPVVSTDGTAGRGAPRGPAARRLGRPPSASSPSRDPTCAPAARGRARPRRAPPRPAAPVARPPARRARATTSSASPRSTSDPARRGSTARSSPRAPRARLRAERGRRRRRA